MDIRTWLADTAKGVLFFLLAIAALSIFRLAFFYCYRSPDIGFGSEIPALMLGSRVDAKWFGILMLPAWILWCAAPLVRPAGAAAKALSVAALFVMVLFDAVNFGFYGFYQTPISSVIFGFLQDDTEAITKTIISDWPVIRYLLAIAAATAVPALLAAKLLKGRLPPMPSEKRCVFFTIAVGSLLLGIMIRGSFGVFPLRLQDFDVSPVAFVNNTVPNGAAAFYEAMKDQNALKLKGGAEEGLRQLGYASPGEAEEFLRASDPKAASDIPAARGDHVVFALMESMGRDEFDSQKPGVNDVRGSLEGTLKDALWFPNGVAVGNGTFPSIEGLLYDTPLTPISQSRYGNQKFSFSNVRQFKDAGYRTVFVTSGSSKWRNLARSLPLQGFDSVLGAEDVLKRFPEAEKGVWGVGDEWTFKFAEELLRKADESHEKVFLMVLSVTNHPPYAVPDGRKTNPVSVSALPKYVLRNLPEKQMHDMLMTYQYSCGALGGFVKSVRSSPLGSRTVIAATGDHNARFNYEPEGWWHHANGVPVIFWVPEAVKSAVKTDTGIWVSHRDIFPTLSGLVLGKKPELYQGRNLFALSGNTAADTFTELGRYGFALDRQGAVSLDGPGSKRCYRYGGDGSMVRTDCTASHEKLWETARARHALSDYTVRKGLLGESR